MKVNKHLSRKSLETRHIEVKVTYMCEVVAKLACATTLVRLAVVAQRS